MRSPFNNSVCRALLSLATLCLLSPAVWTAPSNYSMQIDGAAESLLLDIASAGDQLVTVGERGHILYSSDKGLSWIQAEVPITAMLTRVFFVSPQLGWAVGHDGNVLVSYNSGVNWALQRDGVAAQRGVNEVRAGMAKERVIFLQDAVDNAPPGNRTKLIAKLEAAQSRLIEAQLDLEETVFAPPLMDVWFADEKQGWASGAYGTLLHTSNGGRQWQDWSHKVDNDEQLHLNGIAGTPDGSLYLASEWGTIFRSSTGGKTWEAIASGYEGSFFGLIVNPDTGSVFAYGLRGTVYRTLNGGMHWSSVQAKAQDSLFGACATKQGRLIFVGSNGTVTQSEDNGENFTLLVQDSRLGVYGIAPTVDGNYIVTGEKGPRPLIDSTNSTGPDP